MRDLKNCQNCHDVHALLNPKLDAKTIKARAKELTQLQEAYKAHVADGERLAQQAKWEPARRPSRRRPGQSPKRAGAE